MDVQQTVVVKLGGSLLDTLPNSFFEECVALKNAGVNVVIVHGGGPKIDAYAKQLKMTPRFVDGLRVTDRAMLEIVEMVLGGTVNKMIVSRLEQAGGCAIGLSGVDRGLLQVRQQHPSLGYVGKIERVESDVLHQLCALGWIPVIASLGVDDKGQHYNINADTSAGAVAEALAADRLVLVTDVTGILGKDGQPVACATVAQIGQWLEEGVIYGGMVPKVKAAVACVKRGIPMVCIADGHRLGVLTGLIGKGGASLFPGTRIIAEGSEADGTHGDVFALAHRSG